jgi:D-alanyl-lipoteichoic acid acyltransferase DltB (MBOAT superfamily)
MIGLSYILFRFLQLLIDRFQGSLPRLPTFLDFLAYIIYFPALISGPVHKYDEFNNSLIERPIANRDFSGSYKKLLNGIFKALVMAPLVQQVFYLTSYYIFLGRGTELPTGWAKILVRDTIPIQAAVPLSLVIYPIYLYFNFSGYTDIVIAVSSFFGISLPENFNRPFKARNVSEFWSRWHISLSDWFKNYLFNPMIGSLTALVPHRQASSIISVFTIFSVFFLIGLWHGSTLVYVYYGLYLGVSAAVHRCYQIAMVKWIGQKAFRNLGKNAIYSHFCRVLTFGYFSMALSCFWMNAKQIQEVIKMVPLGPTMMCFIGILAVVSVIFATLDRVETAIQSFSGQILMRVPSTILEPMWMGSFTFVNLFFIFASNSSPGFVYQGY